MPVTVRPNLLLSFTQDYTSPYKYGNENQSLSGIKGCNGHWGPLLLEETGSVCGIGRVAVEEVMKRRVHYNAGWG